MGEGAEKFTWVTKTLPVAAITSHFLEFGGILRIRIAIISKIIHSSIPAWIGKTVTGVNKKIAFPATTGKGCDSGSTINLVEGMDAA